MTYRRARRSFHADAFRETGRKTLHRTSAPKPTARASPPRSRPCSQANSEGASATHFVTNDSRSPAVCVLHAAPNQVNAGEACCQGHEVQRMRNGRSLQPPCFSQASLPAVSAQRPCLHVSWERYRSRSCSLSAETSTELDVGFENLLRRRCGCDDDDISQFVGNQIYTLQQASNLSEAYLAAIIPAIGTRQAIRAVLRRMYYIYWYDFVLPFSSLTILLTEELASLLAEC